MPADPIFTPLAFRNLKVKNRIFRSNISGRFDNYDGSGNQARINWETSFAKGGVGGIISSFVPISIRGRIMPNYATIDTDARIPFWREVGKRVHGHDCKFILQLSHAGRQRDIPGIEFPKGLSSTARPDPLHGFEADPMSAAEIRQVVTEFAAGARRAREAGLDGVELHGAKGYLITQFLSPAINDRKDKYGGSLKNRARFLLEVMAAIRAEVGVDFHVQVKLSARDFNNALQPLASEGTTLQDSLQVAQWLEAASVDALHISSGNAFPHPKNPPGDFPVESALQTFDSMISSGKLELANYLSLASPAGQLFRLAWINARGETIEGINLDDASKIRAVVGIPVLCTGGFQTASFIRNALNAGQCDAVSIARPLIANRDLPRMFADGLDSAPKPCTYCNKCLVNVIENPLGCYEEARYGSREEMIAEIMTVYSPPALARKEKAKANSERK